jgi:hypothetical protein
MVEKSWPGLKNVFKMGWQTSQPAYYQRLQAKNLKPFYVVDFVSKPWNQLMGRNIVPTCLFFDVNF